MSTFRELFFAHDGLPCDRWHHYFEIYDRHLARFRETPVRFLEIGVQKGGSLQLWRKFLGDDALIVGLDVDPTCVTISEGMLKTSIVIGDQANRMTLDQCVTRLGGLDVVLDDGGHMNEAQRETFLELYPRLSERGVYICEDVHTSYWPAYHGGLRDLRSFVEFSKLRIDALNADHNGLPLEFARMTNSIHFYDSLIVYERGTHPPAVRSVQGKTP